MHRIICVKVDSLILPKVYYDFLYIAIQIRLYHHLLKMRCASTCLGVLPYGIVVSPDLTWVGIVY